MHDIERDSRPSVQNKEAFYASLSELEKRMGYTFKRKYLLVRALTSPDAQIKEDGEFIPHNKELETIGDLVIKAFTLNFMYGDVQARSGTLKALRETESSTSLHHILNCNSYFSLCGLALKLNEHVRISKNRVARAGAESCARRLADTFEALIGALYIDTEGAIPETLMADLLFPSRRYEFYQSIARLTSQSTEVIKQGLRDITHDNSLHLEFRGRRIVIHSTVAFDVEKKIGHESLREVALFFLKKYPWIWWKELGVKDADIPFPFAVRTGVRGSKQ